MEDCFDYQRQIWKWLSYVTVTTHCIDRTPKGDYVIRPAGRIRQSAYYVMWFNSIAKVIYLLLTYQGWLVEVHFLDQMSIWDWFLCTAQLVQEINIWYRRNPLYEVLHSSWTVQDDIFRKLGRPEHVAKKIFFTSRFSHRLHTIMTILGPSSLFIQFFFYPKYALNTYAIFPEELDTIPTRIIFGIHEFLFMAHIGMNQVYTLQLLEVNSINYTCLLKEMTLVLQKLHENAMKEHEEEDMRTVSLINDSRSSGTSRKEIRTESVSSYNISTLMHDYNRLMLTSNAFNAWVGKRMGGTMAANYGQFVSDVFMLVQLLKEPDTDFMAVFFFCEDACAGMVMLFRTLILMSQVRPASQEFLQAFKTYLRHCPNGKYWRKYLTSLKPVVAKLAGYSMQPQSVPQGVNALMNYYIGAAMWKRPLDRIT